VTFYFDSSALVKLVHAEDGSLALERFIAEHPADATVTSQLARTEVVRAVTADGPTAVADARTVLSRVTQLAVTAQLLDAAADLPLLPPLRTLNAIHLASARTVPGLRSIVTYDQRMAAAAESLGLPVDSPT
jgi:uncharacterized protein